MFQRRYYFLEHQQNVLITIDVLIIIAFEFVYRDSLRNCIVFRDKKYLMFHSLPLIMCVEYVDK